MKHSVFDSYKQIHHTQLYQLSIEIRQKNNVTTEIHMDLIHAFTYKTLRLSWLALYNSQNKHRLFL